MFLTHGEETKQHFVNQQLSELCKAIYKKNIRKNEEDEEAGVLTKCVSIGIMLWRVPRS
jgi:hypothetical protein